MMPVLMISERSGGTRVDPVVADLHLQAGRRGPRQRGDQVDVAVFGGPDVADVGAHHLRRLAHGRVADGAGERRTVVHHVVEERLVTPDAFGDHVQEPTLQVGDRVVEPVQHLGDAGHGRLRQQLVGVGLGELALEGMARFDRRRPVEHLLPVGLVARRRGLDEQAGVARLAVGARRDELLLGLRLEFEELAQHAVRRVEQILGQVVAGVHETGRETAA